MPMRAVSSNAARPLRHQVRRFSRVNPSRTCSGSVRNEQSCASFHGIDETSPISCADLQNCRAMPRKTVSTVFRANGLINAKIKIRVVAVREKSARAARPCPKKVRLANYSVSYHRAATLFPRIAWGVGRIGGKKMTA
jgi:hypothetical protein